MGGGGCGAALQSVRSKSHPHPPPLALCASTSVVVIKATWQKELSEAPDEQRGCKKKKKNPTLSLVPEGVVTVLGNQGRRPELQQQRPFGLYC